MMSLELILQWLTVLGIGSLLTKGLDIAWAGFKEAREARQAPLDELEVVRRSRLLWMDYATTCKAVGLQNGVPGSSFPPLPDDPVLGRKKE